MRIIVKLIFTFCLFFIHSLHATLNWTTPIEISTPGEESSNPQIVIDQAGNITAAWNVDYTNYKGAVAVTKPLASNWTLPINISPANENALMLCLKGNSNGDAIAIWSSCLTIGTATKRFNESWQPAETIPSHGKIFNVQSVIDQAGNETAIWIKRSLFGFSSVVQSATKPAGGSWQDTPYTISPPLLTVDNLHLVVDQVGNATAIWEAGGDVLITAIFMSQKSFGGTWDGPFMLTSLDPVAFQPQIAVDPLGNVTAIWSEGRCHMKLRSIYKPFEGSWEEPQTVFAIEHKKIFNPQLAVDGNGNATAVWQVQDNCFNSIIQSSFKPFQESWQAIPDQLSTGLCAMFSQVAVNAKGDATVVWQLNDNNPSVIQASSKPFGENWQTTPDTLSSSFSCTAPQVIMNPLGNALAIWQAQNGSDVFIQASEQLIPLAVDFVSPNFGSTLGETEVTITGTGFTSVTAVSFGSIPATSFTINSDTSITTIAPSQAAGTVDVTVANAIETSTLNPADAYTYIAPPTVIYVSPDNGPTTGGVETSIQGTSFTTAISVYFGDIPAVSFTILSDTDILAIAPPQEAGVVDIVVTNKLESNHAPSTKALFTTNLAPIIIDHFIYLQDVTPHVNSLTPNFGLVSGGIFVVIQGSHFATASAVSFGDQPATSFTVNSDTSITAIAPAHAAGTVSVVVTTAFGPTSATPESSYTYSENLFVPIHIPLTPLDPPTPPVPPVPPISFPILPPLPPLETLLPPTNVRGHQKVNKFLTQTEFVNIIKWDPPSEGTPPVAYHIYRDASLNKRIGIVKAKSILEFEDHHRKRGHNDTYFIVSVDKAGVQSAPISVVVHSLK